MKINKESIPPYYYVAGIASSGTFSLIFQNNLFSRCFIFILDPSFCGADGKPG